MEKNIIWTTQLPSHIHNEEIAAELVKIAGEQNYPIQKAKLYKKLEKYAGFNKNYMIIATKLPPVPGGWTVDIETFEVEERQIMLNVKVKDEDGKKVGVINPLVLKMIDEYKKEGLEISIEEEVKEFYGNPVRILTTKGHTIVNEELEDFVENMR